MIIGLTGSFCGGKDSVAEYLMTKGFVHFSISDMIRDEVRKRRQKLTRKCLRIVGNDLREKYGDGILGMRALEKTKKGKDYVITSIRHPEEVKTLMKSADFTLVKVDAPVRLRFERMAARKREEDPETFEEFRIAEEKEMATSGSSQRIGDCNRMAKIVLMNDASIPILHGKIDRLVNDLKKNAKTASADKEEPYVRPSWDEYFIGIMHQVAARATCNRGRSGCVVVKDKRILVTGYVGSPPGIEHCDEAGHEYKKTMHEDGHVSNHCVRTTHAEQNALCQAAKVGISLDGATLYCKMSPCYVCAKMIITCGIRRVVAFRDYHGAAESKRIFKEAGVRLEIVNKEVQQYRNM